MRVCVRLLSKFTVFSQVIRTDLEVQRPTTKIRPEAPRRRAIHLYADTVETSRTLTGEFQKKPYTRTYSIQKLNQPTRVVVTRLLILWSQNLYLLSSGSANSSG